MDQLGFEEIVEEYHDQLSEIEFEPLEGSGWICRICFEDGDVVVITSSKFETLLWDVRNYLILGDTND